MQKLRKRTADLSREVNVSSGPDAQTEGNTCAGSRAATVQEDLITGSNSVDTDKESLARTYRQPNPSWKRVNQNSLDVLRSKLVMTGGGCRRRHTHIIQNVIYNLDRLLRIYKAPDVTGPDYWMRGVRGFGTVDVDHVLTFVLSIGFFHMVREGENLRAMPRDCSEQHQLSGAVSVGSDPKRRTMKHKAVARLSVLN